MTLRELAPSRHRCDIERCALFFEAAEIAIESGPIDREMWAVEKRFLRRDGFSYLRGDGSALAGDFRRDPLGELAQRTIVEEEGDFGLAEHVNEAGATMRPLASISRLAWASRKSPICGEAIAADGDVSRIPGISGAIDDVPHCG